MDKPTQIYKEEVSMGTKILIDSFSLCIDEMFKKPLIISPDAHNPFAELPIHVKSAIIQSAFTKILAQQLASLALMGEEAGVQDKEVLSMGRNVLKHEFEQYLKAWRRARELNKNSVGEGSETGHGSGKSILDPGPQGSQDKEGSAVCDHNDSGQDGGLGHKAMEQPASKLST